MAAQKKRGKLPQKRNAEGGCPQSVEDWFFDRTLTGGLLEMNALAEAKTIFKKTSVK